MRIALHSHEEHDHYHLPHQWVWFVLMLLSLFLLLSKTVSTRVSAQDDQCVIAYSRMLMPIAYPSTEKL